MEERFDLKLIWTDEELEILKKYYPTAETNELLELLPRFTIEKIRIKAHKLGIKREKKSKRQSSNKFQRWTEDEVEKLKQVYSHSTNEELLKLFPQFNMRQIRYKARSLKLEKLEDIKKKDLKQRVSKMLGDSEWTEEEERLLEENYNMLGSVGMIKLLPNRTQQAISSKAQKMGLTTEYEAIWEAKDVRISQDDVFSISVLFERVDR